MNEDLNACPDGSGDMNENDDNCMSDSMGEPSPEAWDEVLGWLNALEENSESLVLRHLSKHASLTLGGISDYFERSKLHPDQGPFH